MAEEKNLTDSEKRALKYKGKNLLNLCPKLTDALASTYGTIVYQEQVMQIVRDLAGYSMGRSDLVRRAMSKKKAYVIEAERQNFVYGNEKENIPGCIKNGIDEDLAHYIYDKMVDFAKYAFNKSHAVVYAKTSYVAAYLKYHYGAAYLCAVMNFSDNIDALQGVINDAFDFGIKVLPPNINNSESRCIINQDHEILFGLSLIKGVGVAAAQKAKENIPYTNIADFIIRGCDNTKAMQSLIAAGAFDHAFSESNFSRKTYLEHPNIAKIVDINKKMTQKQSFIDNAMKVCNFVEDYYEQDVEELKKRIKKEKITYAITSKKVPTKEQIQIRINTAKNTIDQQMNEINLLMSDITNIEDDQRELLIHEKEVLGVFLSGHLIDSYSIRSSSTPIEAIDEGYYTVSGIITDVEYKKGINFIVQDRTGSIRCHVFVKQAADYDLHDYDAVEIEGKISIDDFRSTEDEVVYQMIPKTIRPLRTKKIYRWETNSADYMTPLHIIQQYKDPNNEGFPIYIRSFARGCDRKCTFTVTEDIEKCSEITIVKQ